VRRRENRPVQGLLTMARGGVRRAVTYLGLAMGGVALMTGEVAGLVSHEDHSLAHRQMRSKPTASQVMGVEAWAVQTLPGD